MSEADDRLTRSLARFNRSSDWFEARVGRPPKTGWVAGADLATNGDALAARVRDVAARYGQDQLDVGAAYVTGFIARAIAQPVIWAWTLDRLGADLAPSRVWLRHHPGGWFDGFAMYPGDVAGDDDLARRLVDLLSPVVENIRPHAPFGYRGLWGMVADALAAGGADAATHGDLPDRSSALVTTARVLAAARPPFPAHPGFTVVAIGGRDTLLARRSACCLAYKTGMELCTTCPLRRSFGAEPRKQWFGRRQ